MPEAQIKSHTSESVCNNNEERQKKIDELRKMIEDYDILNIRTDDIFLTRFLSCCEWNAVDAFNRIKKLFKLKYEHPKWFLNRKLADCNDILKQNAKLMLPGRDIKGRRVYLSRMSAVGQMSLYDLALLDDLWFEAMLNENETIENGIVVLVDMSGYSWKMLKWLAPTNVKVASTKAELLPLKQMEVHVVNSSALMNTAISLVFPLLSQSIKDQVHFHYQNFSSLHEYIGIEVCPDIYGGLQKLEFCDLNNYLYKHEDYLNKSLTYGFIKSPSEVVKDKKKQKKESLVIAEGI
ncbi:hypothetical protein PVAND_004835 [Polypedilum vanderplanki]|uniref:CRAL-TRIO domain-containing protein n=1 Tax=Polypedilum vanderplanki TaxID=319348 RepID=A0A9J6BYR9_POLVA|nr:hypothetical protein PVAND_004835 [Polypedilum vanderplanki]